MQDPFTEDPKGNPISDYPEKDPMTEDPKRIQGNIDTTMYAIVGAIGTYR